MRSRAVTMAGLLLVAGCAAPGGSAPPFAGYSTHAMQCDASGTQYVILEPGRYYIHLDSKTIGDKADASLCVEPTPDGWRPPDPCRSNVRVDEWRTDQGSDWSVELRAGSALAVWIKEGSFNTRASTRCPAGAQVDTANFSGSGGFHATFVVTRH